MVRTGKIVTILVSLVMAISLVLMSCAQPEAEQPTGGGIKVTTTQPGGQQEEPETGTETEPETGPGVGMEQQPEVNPDKPQYGGTLTMLTNTNIDIFMPGVQNRGVTGVTDFVYEQILGLDRTKGLAGSGESDFAEGVTDFKYVTGHLAEDWETPAIGVWNLNIRQGIHYGFNPDTAASREVSGREMTAEDVAYNIEWMRDTPSSWIQFAEPTLIKSTTVERTGPWSITVNTPVAPTTTYLWIMGGGGNQYVLPKETLDNHGTDNDWQNVVGTGPYILKDFVSDSAATYVKNDNYWETNPVGPGQGDKLPYPDGVNYLIVPDLSTRLAAFRTGKADYILGGFGGATAREDYEQLKRTNPDMKAYQTIIAPLQISGRIDIPEDPFSKLEVRQALYLATDNPGIKKDLYGGQAELLDSPARKLYPTIYTPIEELDQTTQELFGYNPDKAKELLADAGYPDGFRVTLTIQNTPESSSIAEAIKAMWEQVGVIIDINVLETGAFIGVWAGHQTEDWMLTTYAGGTGSLFVRYSMGYYRGPNIFNISHVDDPIGSDQRIEDAFTCQAENVNINYPEADRCYKEVIANYILPQAFNIQMPAPYGYRIWQPWMKNYYGEAALKFWLQYVWIDEGLKKEMGH